MPIGSSLSRIQLTASCPALDTPCSPADFSESVPRIATCWGPPGASWSPHFSLLTPEEKEIRGGFYLCKKGHGQRESLWCRTVTSWNTRTGHVPKSLNYPKGILLQEPDRAQCRTNLFIQRVCWQNYIPCQSWLQISLGGKQKYFEYQGGIDLDWFNLSTLTTEIPNRASCFTGMSLMKCFKLTYYTWISKRLLLKSLFRSCYANSLREQNFGGINNRLKDRKQRAGVDCFLNKKKRWLLRTLQDLCHISQGKQ